MTNRSHRLLCGSFMPERSTTTADTTSWPLQPRVQASVRVKQALLMVCSLGFLSGYYLMPNQWIHLGWMGLMLGTCFWVCGWQEMTEGLRDDVWLRTVTTWIFVLLVRSSLLDSPGMGIRDLWWGWFHAGLLLLVLGMLWQTALHQTVLKKLLLPLTSMALLAAVVSVLVFYVLGDKALVGVRLRNWFVFGGWNSVCTGMTFGFAAVWALDAWNTSGQTSWLNRLFWLLVSMALIFATLMTMSRGAAMSLTAAALSLAFSQNWRRVLRPQCLLVGCFLLFQFLAPLISSAGIQEISARLAIPTSEVTPEVVADQIISADPLARFIERGDTGRFIIYAAALSSMTSWQDWLWGKGLWSADDFWSCALHWYPEHLHSVFMDALVRGGLLGLIGLLFILGWGMLRAIRIARCGEPLWLMLICFGAAGVAFDGASAFTTLSVSRFEMLLFWVPLVMASARYSATDGPFNRCAKITPHREFRR